MPSLQQNPLPASFSSIRGIQIVDLSRRSAPIPNVSAPRPLSHHAPADNLAFLLFCRNEKDLDKLSELGHFLKGSSATLGLIKVRDGCEKIQRYGKQENLDGSPEPDTNVCLERVKEALTAVKSDYEEVEVGLKKFYDKDDEEEEGA